MLRSLFAGMWAKTGTLGPSPAQVLDFETTAESYPAITTPATFSFARRFYGSAYRDLARLRGASAEDLAAHEAAIAGILAFREGRIGIDVACWAVYESLLAHLAPVPDLAGRGAAYLSALPANLAAARALPYAEAEPLLFSGAGLLVATDMAVVTAFATVSAELAAAGADPRGPAGAAILASCAPGAHAARAPGEMLLERAAPPPIPGAAGPSLRAAPADPAPASTASGPAPGPSDRGSAPGPAASGPGPPTEPARQARLPPVQADLACWLGRRERMRGARAEIVAAARDLLVAASAGLPDPGARWLLSVEELAGLAPPPAGPVLAARERDLARWRAAAIPATPGAAHPGGRVLRGTVASPGRARGPARIVRDPASAPDLAGRILVAEYTDPGWAPLFAAAEAIALQHGNPLSHAAILARELGKPALVGVRDLLATVPEDARVEVDATAGELRLLT